MWKIANLNSSHTKLGLPGVEFNLGNLQNFLFTTNLGVDPTTVKLLWETPFTFLIK